MIYWRVNIFQFILIFFLVTKISSKIEFTNLKCTSLDKDFTDFDYCYIKSINRTYKYVSLKVKLYKVPITNVTVNFSFMKRSSGYKLFLYNITADACKFLKNPKSNPVLGYMYGLFKSHSNMNHTCPFDHDLVMEKVSSDFINNQLTQMLPFPEGEYLFKTNWMAYGILRASVNAYVTLT
ncbi:uncharacterized protein [Drosophila bipectinata]|uniref:uncharacterized protein isoform X1 n=1 Tax=Drosophila bipectinata TaxID=42026 RepID=UPI001C8ACCD9|nr:uncharacterized protein LOC108119950 [Drosophila bipectinata]